MKVPAGLLRSTPTSLKVLKVVGIPLAILVVAVITVKVLFPLFLVFVAFFIPLILFLSRGRGGPRRAIGLFFLAGMTSLFLTVRNYRRKHGR